MATSQTSSESLPASTSKGKSLTATCHCSRIHIQVPSKPQKLNECHCTVCYKYGALWGYFPRSEVLVTIADDTQLQAYAREDRPGHVSFHRCGHCGCMLFWRGEGKFAGPEHMMGVNLRMLPESQIEDVEREVSMGP